MKRLSMKPTKYIFFEIARLRTLWTNQEENRDRIEERYKLIKDEFGRRNLIWRFNEHPIDKIVKEKYTKSNEEEICKVECVENSKYSVGPLKGVIIENIYEYTLSKDDKIIGRTTGTNIVAEEGEQVMVLKISPRVYDVVDRINKDVNSEGKKGKWITLDNGQHLFVEEGQSVGDAMGRLKEKPKEKDIDIKTDINSPKGYDFSLLEKEPDYWYYEQDMFTNKTNLAVKDNKVFGAIGYQNKEDEIVVDKIIIVSESRGEGIGSKLINNIKQEATIENKKIIAYPLNDKALDFFHKQGFTGEVSVVWKPQSKKKIIDKAEGKWITLDNGQHLFIREGESVNDAIGRLNKPKELKITSHKEETKKILEEQLSKLPKKHLEGLTVDAMNTIEFETLRGFGVENPHGEVAAFYIKNDKNVVVRETNVNTSEGKQYLYHEVGHHVYYEKLSQDTAYNWNDFWVNNKRSIPSDYGRISPSEGFAETYAAIQDNPFSVDREVRKWFTKYQKEAYGFE